MLRFFRFCVLLWVFLILVACGGGDGPKLVSISIDGASSNLVLGASRQLIATGRYSNGITSDITSMAQWRSSDETVALVDNGEGTNGIAASVGVGITTISASLNGITGSTSIKVIIIGGGLQGKPLNVAGAVSTLTPALFYGPNGITTDRKNLYVTDAWNHVVRKVVISTGAVTTIAGQVGVMGGQDGTGLAATFRFPCGITTDGANLYVAENSSIIRKIVIATGAVSTLAGSYMAIGSKDGTGTEARFFALGGITSDGTSLFVLDCWNHTVRKIDLATRNVTTLAGTPGEIGSTDGVGALARFGWLKDITTDGTNLYVTEYNGNSVRKIVITTAAVSTIAGGAGTYGSADGIGMAARFDYPAGITTDGSNLYITDLHNATIRKMDLSTSMVTTLAGSVGLIGSADGIGSVARFNYPTGITSDGSSLFVADASNNVIRQIH